MNKIFLPSVWLLVIVILSPLFCTCATCNTAYKASVGPEKKKAVFINTYSQLKKCLNASNTTYVIKETIDLRGNTIAIPDNSELLFMGGRIKNGVIVGKNTSIAGNPRIGARMQGTFQNKLFRSSWFDNESSITVSAVKMACSNNAALIIDDERILKETLYVFGKGVLKGEGGSLNFISKTENGVCVLCGTDGKTPLMWSGSIDNIVFNISDYKYGIALCNVAHCSVTNNTLNATAIPSYKGGKLISRFNNRNFTHLSGAQTDITISGNTLNMHGKTDGTESKASYESISVCDFTENARIVNNAINNSTDDVGIHSCTNILVEENTITTEDGRIYCADSKNVTIANNTLSCYSYGTMGIMITMESQNRVCENIIVKGNKVHALSLQGMAYGIRVNNGKHIQIENNQVEGQLHIGYQDFVIENRSGKPVDFTEKDLIVDYVTVKNNYFTQINGTGWNKTNNTPKQVLFEDNVISGPKYNVSNVPTVVSRRNAVGQGSKK